MKDKKIEEADKRLLTKHTGSLTVTIVGIGRVEVFGRDWSIIQFILIGYKLLTKVDRRTIDKKAEQKESKNWQLIRSFFHENDGVVEVKIIGDFFP